MVQRRARQEHPSLSARCGIADRKDGSMSLRNRARQLQRSSGLTYQQALVKLRALGVAPAELRKQTGWPLAKCDLYLLGLRPPEKSVPAPRIEVVWLDHTRSADPLREICDRLLTGAAAKAVCLVDPSGKILTETRPLRAKMVLSMAAISLPYVAPRKLSREGLVVTIDGDTVYLVPVGQSATLAVLFDEKTSLGLVILRARRAIEELEIELARQRKRNPPHGPHGGAGSDGPSGLPAQARVFLDTSRKRGKG
jgi:hypothetical protein